MSEVVRVALDSDASVVHADDGRYALVAGGDVTFFDTADAAADASDAQAWREIAAPLELVAAAGARLDVEVTPRDEPRRVYRVPSTVRREAERGVRWVELTGADPEALALGRRLARASSVDVDFVAGLLEHQMHHAPDTLADGFRRGTTGYPSAERVTYALAGGAPGLAWANKIARTHSLTMLSSAFAPDPESTYLAILAAGEPPRATGLLASTNEDLEEEGDPNATPPTLDKFGQTYERRIPGAWESMTFEETQTLDLLEIDVETAAALAAWVDEDPVGSVPDGEAPPLFDLLAVNTLERNLFDLAAPYLDVVELERAALAAGDGNYTPQERSQNVQRQARASDGKFGGGSAAPTGPASKTTTAFARAHLPTALPLVEDVGALIDDYLAANRPDSADAPVDDDGETDQAPLRAAGEPDAPVPASDPAPAEAASSDAPPGPEGVTPLYLAIVDAVDTQAVLDLAALVPPAAPGEGDAVCYRRDGGAWVAAPDLLADLRSTTPPGVVQLTDPEMVTAVVDQVDASTAKDAADEAAPPDAATPVTPMAASAGAYFAYGQYGETFPVAALAASGAPGIADTPADHAAVKRLQRYWSHGEGAAKVRWGTPGDLTRCHTHVAKFMSPDRAWGFCFAGETELLTRDGTLTFAEAAGTDQFVLTAPAPSSENGKPVNTGGIWVEAPIRSYGEQRVLSVTLTRNKVTKTVRATPEHTWFASPDGRSAARGDVSEVQTRDLAVGMSLAALLPKTTVWRSSPSPIGVAAGFVYGDGHRERGRDRGSVVDLWGDKDAALLPYFAGLQQSPTKNPNGVLGVRVRGLPGSWKETPRLDEGTTHLFGWLAGYLAADATVTKAGTVQLYSAHRASLEFAATVATRLGISVYGIKTATRVGLGQTEPSKVYSLGFVATTVPPALLVIPEHRKRLVDAEVKQTPVRWKVQSVEDFGEVEEVFCAEVPETETFALTDQVWVHNCQLRHRDATGTWNER